jgi:hypothetical protein
MTQNAIPFDDGRLVHPEILHGQSIRNTGTASTSIAACFLDAEEEDQAGRDGGSDRHRSAHHRGATSLAREASTSELGTKVDQNLA